MLFLPSLIMSVADMFRSLWRFGVFNAIQSTCFDMVREFRLTLDRNEPITILRSELHLHLLTADSNHTHVLRIYQSDRNVMISAPTGAGKTVRPLPIPVPSLAVTPRRFSSNSRSSDSSRRPNQTPKSSTSLPRNLSVQNAPSIGRTSSLPSAGTSWNSRATQHRLDL